MLGLLNTKSDLKQKLSKDFDVCELDNVQPDDLPHINGLFIDWISNKNEFEYAHQAVIIENYIKKGVPTVLFDRYLALSYKEFSWLDKFNVTFLEPAVNNRSHFEYFPFWTEPLKPLNYFAEEKPREIDIAYKGNLSDRIESFEQYYKEYARLFPKRKIVFQTKPNGLELKIDEWSNFNLMPAKVDFNNVMFSIIIGSKKEYKIGYLPENVFYIMNSGCIPLLPRENRFFGTILSNFYSIMPRSNKIYARELHYIISTWPKIRKVIIEEIFEDLLKSFPEMAISTAVERLKMWFTI